MSIRGSVSRGGVRPLVAGILEILLGFWAAQQYLSVQRALPLVGVGPVSF